MAHVEKHLLVTISDDANALFGLRFVHGFFSLTDNLRLTLFYVQPSQQHEFGLSDPVVLAQGSAPAFSSEADKTPAVLIQAKNWLVNMGFPADRVDLKTTPSKLGPVKDIAHEAEQGLYDAVVLGRRGLSWFDEFFLDSVTHRLLWESITFPLWVCRNPSRRNQNVLLCVDGSEQSMRMADHVGFVLQDQPSQQVTVFHDRSLPMVGGGRIDEVLASVEKLLLDQGIEKDRVSFLVKSSSDPAGLILTEAKAGNYAAVAIGRSSGKPHTLASIFGSTSLTLLRNLEGASLWLSK